MAINLFNKKLTKSDDYTTMWSKFCFLDECGTLHDDNVPFFTVGIIKCTEPYYLNQTISKIRNRHKFFEELKFNKLSKLKISFVKELFKTFLYEKSINFYSYTIDKSGNYYKTTFHSNQWKAYEELTSRLITSAVLAPNEILILLADDITTPDSVKFEMTVKQTINDQNQRLAIAGVCRLNSKSNDILQLTDLIIGTINYSLKLETNFTSKGDRYKKSFVQHVLKELKIDGFIDGYKDKKFNIFVDKDIKIRTKKGPSSKRSTP